MTTLVAMADAHWDAFAEEAVSGYAQDNVTAGRWLPEGALQRSKAEFDQLLPQGRHTADHRFFDIRDGADGDAVVGFLWFAVVGSGPARGGFIYNIRVHPAFRGRGHAKAALDLIEQLALDEGLPAIGLHVFGFNTGAQALYRAQGYGITGFNMRKPLLRG